MLHLIISNRGSRGILHLQKIFSVITLLKGVPGHTFLSPICGNGVNLLDSKQCNRCSLILPTSHLHFAGSFSATSSVATAIENNPHEAESGWTCILTTLNLTVFSIGSIEKNKSAALHAM